MMLAARPSPRPEYDDATRATPPQGDAADWLTLQQAACELNVSPSTVRRRIRRGDLRNRIVRRPGGFAYLIYLPGSRHARQLGMFAGAGQGVVHVCGPEPVSLEVYRLRREARPNGNGSANGYSHSPAVSPSTGDEVRILQQQVDRLSEALSRALRTKQRALPAGVGEPQLNTTDPYARYRWLARRRRWWPF
ncbi:MAG: hypothetical protein WEC75_07120 [Dehalococcoidia bacterium]